MLVCGYNKYLQLDRKSTAKHIDGPIIDDPCHFHVEASNISSFSTNQDQTVYITQNGQAFVIGNNQNGLISGKLPTRKLSGDTKFEIKDSGGHCQKFLSVYCGLDFTLYLVSDQSGSSNFHLVLCYSNFSPNPLFVNIKNRTPRALFGGDHTAAVVDTEGGIFFLTKSIFNSPKKPLKPLFLPNNDKPVKIACIINSFVLLGESGKVYECKENESFFNEVKELANLSAVDVSGISNFCHVVLEDGRVFGRGDNYYCKLGFPEKVNRKDFFFFVDSLSSYNIVAAYCGTFHSIFKTDDGKMIVCGNNSRGQLFSSQSNTIFPPEELPNCKGFSFCEVGSLSSVAFFDVKPTVNFANTKILTSDFVDNVNKDIIIEEEEEVESDSSGSSKEKRSNELFDSMNSIQNSQNEKIKASFNEIDPKNSIQNSQNVKFKASFNEIDPRNSIQNSQDEENDYHYDKPKKVQYKNILEEIDRDNLMLKSQNEKYKKLLDDANKKIDKYKKRLDDANNEKEEYQSTLQDIIDVNSDLNAQNTRNKKQLQTINKENTDLKAKCNEYENRLQMINKENADIKAKNENYKKNLQMINKENADMKTKIKGYEDMKIQIEKRLQMINKENKDLKAKNKTCEDMKEQSDKRLQAIDNENKNLQAINAKYTNQIQTIEKENSDLKAKNKNLEEIIIKAAAAKSTSGDKIDEYENRIKKLKIEIEDYKNRFNTIDIENSDLKTQNEKYEKQIKQMNKEYSDLKTKTEEYEEIVSKITNKCPPSVLGPRDMKNYKKGKHIGRGATSDVFEVIQEKKLALKVLNLETCVIYRKKEKVKKDKEEEDEEEEEEEEEEGEIKEINFEVVTKFLRECEILNELKDPRIIKTYGFFTGDEDNPPAILLELCETNLKKKINKLSNPERRKIIFDVSLAMKNVHSIGIIHRDLKIENILLDSNNQAKLSDFGLCTFMKKDDETMNHSQAAGTIKYMAPELLQGRTDYNEKVDVYAFGVVVYVILTKGNYPNISIGDILNGKQADIPKSISKFSSQLIKDCWSFNANDRPSFADICERLRDNEDEII